jgi:hypothetical protein
MNKNRLFITAAAIFSLLLLLTSCGKKEVPRTEAAVGGNSTPAGSAPAAATATPEPTPALSEQELLYYEHSADSFGYFYATHYQDGESYDCVYSKTGQELYRFPEEEKLLVFGGGYFLSADGKGQYLKKVDGTPVCTAESLGATGFGLAEDTEDYGKFLADGYVLAYKVNESYSGVQYEVGILGTDGKWIVPMSASHPIISSGMDCTEQNFKKGIGYQGDGMLLLKVKRDGYSYDCCLYSISDNKLSLFQPEKYFTSMGYLAEETCFQNGVSYDTYGDVIEIHKDGQVKRRPVTTDPNVSVSTIYGFHVGADGTVTTLIDDGWDYLLVNTKGQTVKSFKDLDLTTGVFDGTVPVIITNKENGHYYTVIDLKGEFLFEPVKLPEGTVAVYTPQGKKVEVDGMTANAYGSRLVIDDTGKTLYTSQEMSTKLKVSNGIVWEYRDNNTVDGRFSLFTRLEK